MNALAPQPPFRHRMTTADFLAWPGDENGRKFELVDGAVTPLSPASYVHSRIQSNVLVLLHTAIRDSGRLLYPTVEGVVVPRLGSGLNARVPDLVVTAAIAERGEQDVSDPILIVEVLSPGNQDRTRANLASYATLPTLQEIAVLHSTSMAAELYRRQPDGAWPCDPEYIAADGRLSLTSAGLDCALAEAYHGTWLARRP